MTGPELATVRWLRGVAVALIALGAASGFIDYSGLRRWTPLDGLVQSSNTGVSLLLASTAYVVVRAAVAAETAPARAALRAWVVELGAVLGALLALALVVLLIAWLDDTDLVPWATTRDSLLGAFTLMWNQLVLDDVLGVRPDVVGAWILSVVAQGASLALVLALVTRGRRMPLLVLTVPLLGAASAWQLWSIDDLGWFRAGLTSHMRVDAVLCGVLAAALSARVAGSAQAAAAHSGGVLLLPGLVLAQAFLGPEDFYRGLGLAVGLAATVVLATASARQATPGVHTLRAAGPLLVLGGAWSAVVALLGPWVQALARRGADWEPMSRVAVTTFGVLVAAYAIDQLLRPAATEVLATWRRGRAAAPVSVQIGDEERRAGGQQPPGA